MAARGVRRRRGDSPRASRARPEVCKLIRAGHGFLCGLPAVLRQPAAAPGPPGPSAPAALSASSTRDVTPSFTSAWDTCVCTVRAEMPSRRAISGLEMPSATSQATRRSAGVRLSHLPTLVFAVLALLADFADVPDGAACTGRA